MSKNALQAINNADTRRTLQVAQLVGRDTLVLAFVEGGFEQAEAQAVTDEVTREVVNQLDLATHHDGDIAKLVDLAEDLIRRMRAVGPEGQNGVEIAEAIVSNDTQVQGRVTDVGTASLLIALSLSLLLGVAKFEGRYDWKTGDGYIAVSEGVPDGFNDMLKAISEAVAGRLANQPPAAPGSVPQLPPQKPAKELPGKRPAKEGEGRVRSEPHPQRHERLSREDALALAADIVRRFEQGDEMHELSLVSPKDLFVSNNEIVKIQGKHEKALKIGAGVVPVRSGGFGVTIRVQSNHYLRTKVMRRIISYYQDNFDAIVGTRWVGPVELVASNPGGDWRPWIGPDNGSLVIGAPINMAGGCVSAVGLFLRRQETYFALTTGHSLAESRPDTVGKEVYFLPQPTYPDTTKLIGTVEKAEFPQRTVILSSLMASAPTVPSFDHALVKLEAGYVPTRDKRMRAGARTFSLNHVIDDEDVMGAQVMKSAARTREAFGVVTAVGVGIEALDHIRGGAVMVGGLCEIEFDRPNAVLPGDSGALMCLERAGTLHPFGICVAAVRRSKIRNPAGKAVSAAYVLPLDATLKRLGGLEIC